MQSTMDSRFQNALRKFDEAHAQDPKVVNPANDDSSIPAELHYANRMTKYLFQHDPSPSEFLRLAVRAQHLRRWEILRSSFPMNRAGYLSWRVAQMKKQAQLAEEICRDCGYSDEDSARVAALVRKENLKGDPECQVLEDVACLVFLDDQLEQFEQDHSGERPKVINILKKTWAKMSERGHELALQINMSDQSKQLITEAISS